MISNPRKKFNSSFSPKKYQTFLMELGKGYLPIPFRVAETPVFLPPALIKKLATAGEEIIALIKHKDFKVLTQEAIPAQWKVPDENDHPHFLTFDFGICKNEEGELIPKLIEMQGFPSLYGFQPHLAAAYKKVFDLENWSPYFNGMTQEHYLALLKRVIIGPYAPHEVALMDIDPETQKTAIDFYITAKYLGIKILNLTAIHKIGKQLFYKEGGRSIRLRRIYNRLIFNEVNDNPALLEQGFDPREALDIEWITHPNWFYRISKYTLPFLKSEFVPETQFLSTLNKFPSDLENYVLKPLFSFGGKGVIIDITKEDLDEITDPENWILQRKVHYEPIIQAPAGNIKVEVRLMYLWPDQEEPQLCINLARLSRGKMIGVNYNKDADWVGGTIGLME